MLIRRMEGTHFDKDEVSGTQSLLLCSCCPLSRVYIAIDGIVLGGPITDLYSRVRISSCSASRAADLEYRMLCSFPRTATVYLDLLRALRNVVIVATNGKLSVESCVDEIQCSRLASTFACISRNLLVRNSGVNITNLWFFARSVCVQTSLRHKSLHIFLELI